MRGPGTKLALLQFTRHVIAILCRARLACNSDGERVLLIEHSIQCTQWLFRGCEPRPGTHRLDRFRVYVLELTGCITIADFAIEDFDLFILRDVPLQVGSER